VHAGKGEVDQASRRGNGTAREARMTVRGEMLDRRTRTEASDEGDGRGGVVGEV